jgi:hypothetical protein
MADVIDQMDDRNERFEDARILAARARAASIPLGAPGDCELCGEWSGRLVNGACAPCRDKHKLP